MNEQIFKEIREKRIRGYLNEPDRLREDAGTEAEIVSDYQGRAVLELLQNADDAQFNPNSDSNFQRVGDSFVEFELSKELLIVRNGGYPISSDGVRSLAGTHISPKDKKVMIGNKGIGFKSVLEITKQPIIHSFPFHFRFSEEDTRNLLQKENLLSILEKVRYCPILRLPFDLLSDQKKVGNGQWATEIQLPLKGTRAYEKSVEMLERIGPEVLIFLYGLKIIRYKGIDKEFCFSCDRESNIAGELKDGEIKISDQSGAFSLYYRWVKTEPIPDQYIEELPKNWQELRLGQVAIAVLLKEEGHEEKNVENRIRVFFPTNDFSPVNIIIHGNFRIDSSRNNILPESYNKWLSGLTGLLLKEKLTQKFLEMWPEDEGKILDYLEPRIDVEEMKGIEKEIWCSINEHLKDYPFIRVARSRRKVSPQRLYIPPDSIKHSIKDLYPQDFDIDGYISADSFFSSDVRTKALLALGADYLTPEKVIESLDNVARPDPEWSAKAISLIVTLIQSQPNSRRINGSYEYNYQHTLAKLSSNAIIFLCSDSNLRKAERECPLFLPSKEKEDGLPLPPEFLNIAFLEKKVFENLDEKIVKGFEDLFVKSDDIEIHNFNRESILRKVVLPWLQENRPTLEQSKRLREFLFDLMNITKAVWNDPWNERENIRFVICKLPVPIRSGGEVPAWQVYAGKEWTGNKNLEKLYSNREDRFFLKAPEKERDEKTRKRWESFYRWLGVSWRPKILPYHLPDKEKQNSTWSNYTELFSFQGPGVSTEKWKNYCHWLYNKADKPYKADDLFDRTPHMKDNRFLDGWEQISKELGSAKIVLQLLTKEAFDNNKEATIKYSSGKSKDNQSRTWRPASFFAYTLKNILWLPALDKKGETQQSAFDLFIPDSQVDRALSGIFPCLNLKDNLLNQTEAFLKEIGVRSEFRELKTEDWKRWASLISRRFPNPDKEEIDKITAFYRRLLDEFPIDEDDSKLPPLVDVDILALKGEQLEYRKPSVCWYLDRPEHKELTRKEEWFFTVTLGKKDKRCEKIFGLKPFSKAIVTEPSPGPIDMGLTDKLSKWFESRKHFLLARLDVERHKSREEDMACLKKIKIQCVKSLKVSYKIKERKIDERSEGAFLEPFPEDGQAILYLNSDAITEPFNECRDLVSSIAKNIGSRLNAISHTDTFKTILSCKDGDLIKELEDIHVPAELITECKKNLEGWKEVKKNKPDEKKKEKPEKPKGDGKEKTPSPANNGEPNNNKPEEKPKDTGKEIIPITPVYIGQELDMLDKLGEGGSGGGGGGSEGSGEHDRIETGKKGEGVLFSELEKRPHRLGFQNISKLLHKSKENPGFIYDIEVLDREKGKFYLEVKSSGSNRDTLSFPMSDRQWGFAEKNQDRYQLWFVSDVWGNSPKISGPHNPLELERQGKLERTPKDYSCRVKLKG